MKIQSSRFESTNISYQFVYFAKTFLSITNLTYLRKSLMCISEFTIGKLDIVLNCFMILFDKRVNIYYNQSSLQYLLKVFNSMVCNHEKYMYSQVVVVCLSTIYFGVPNYMLGWCYLHLHKQWLYPIGFNKVTVNCQF